MLIVPCTSLSVPFLCCRALLMWSLRSVPASKPQWRRTASSTVVGGCRSQSPSRQCRMVAAGLLVAVAAAAVAPAVTAAGTAATALSALAAGQVRFVGSASH